ncbi:MAG: tetratricopeptide repeat protein [Solobacterium sp.]|nr:tetratricopeptide repeat protein [Solobacterium sp.]
MSDRGLKPEDYLEPDCALCQPSRIKPVPQKRIIEKLDEYMSRQDYAGAEKHLLYWMEEARMGLDQRGMLMICNELVGHYRKVGNRAQAFAYGEKALKLLKDLDFDGSISAGTTYTNYATACNAFGENRKALELFEKARAVYENGKARADLLGGQYNNMGLVYAATGRYQDAYQMYDRAMEQMAKVENGELEQAITLLNRCNALEAQYGMEDSEEQINLWLDQAYDLLNKEGIPHDGYYAFVLEKCAPVFSYYGYFMAAEEFAQAAKEIYERT